MLEVKVNGGGQERPPHTDLFPSRPAASHLFPRHRGFSFFDRNDLIDPLHGDLLFQSTGPVDFDFVYPGCGAQAKVDPLVRTRAVASAAEYIRALTNATCGGEDFRSDCVPWALRPSHEFQR